MGSRYNASNLFANRFMGDIMSNAVLVLGESGTGKSTSIRNLDPSETFIINVMNKPLPFKGYKSKYRGAPEEGKPVNYYSTDRADIIEKSIGRIALERPHVKNIVVDDFQYIMSGEFMRRAKERGFDKFTDIGLQAWSIFKNLLTYRDDLTIFVLSHVENTQDGISKIKTIGKMLDEKITIEGLFTVVLHTVVNDGGYKFLTQFEGGKIAKSPMGMFDERYIDNDLQFVKTKIGEYDHD